MERARCVRIDEPRLDELAGELHEAPSPASSLDPAHHRLGGDEATLAYVVCLDAINFGSGWFPVLAKRPGLSGYYTLATALRERFEAHGPWSAAELQGLDAAACAEFLGQDPGDAEVGELMALFARSLNDLGRLLAERYQGRFAALVAEAGGAASRLVELLSTMPLYRDVLRYDDFEVPFYKRAQLTAADLATAFAGEGPGRFRDIDRLTAFADNLVPHVLRREGVLLYDPTLAKRIDAGERIPAGSPEEVEIRAAAVHAIECCVAAIARRGGCTTARQLDFLLWDRGHRPELKAHPRHRTRTPFY